MLSRLLVRALGGVAPVIVIVTICPISPLTGLDLALGQAPSPLRLEISADKKQFLLGEPVWIDVALKNVSQDTVRIPDRVIRPDFGNLDFFVTSESETLRYIGGHATYVSEPINLAPGEEVISQHDILDFYGKPIEGTIALERLFHPGMYSVHARAWRSVVSNTLDVEVVEPSGDDAEIYRVLHEAALLSGQRRFREAAERLYPLLPSASQSAYRDKLYIELMWAVYTDRPRRKSLAAQVLREYPNSRYARKCLYYVFQGMSRAQAEDFVRDLESRAAGTRAALHGRRMLETHEFRE